LTENNRFSIITILILICLLFSCKKDHLSIKESHRTVKLSAGKVEMFNRNNFELNVPELEVNVYEVTNASFADFVEKTGYITTAEKTGEGMVFDLQLKNWTLVKFANWKNPQGPKSTIAGKDDHPVVQVSYDDACAYCDWLEMRLPYESEWEYMYQLDQKYGPVEVFNKWDGIFPIENKLEDGFANTAPVGSFKKGLKGMYDLQGNVWEWTNDFFSKGWTQLDTSMMDPSYTGPLSTVNACTITPRTTMVIKGGSFLCAENYCMGYAQDKRQSADPKLSYEHLGFRCVREVSKK
jgi:formylglycine-generating enzyme required for sulfatase activity